jgi:Tfp pilus assembly protein PilV
MIYLSRKKGMTLIEALLAISIFTIGMLGFSMLFAQTWKNNSYTLEMGQTSMAVSQGVNKMISYIRGAKQSDNGSYPVRSADDNDLVIYSDYDKDDVTERLHFYKSGENILMGITDPTSSMPRSYPSGDQQTITIASHIVNNSGTPIFYYYNENYPGDSENNPMDTPSNAAGIHLVKIYLEMNIIPNRAPDNIKIQSFAELRNLSNY